MATLYLKAAGGNWSAAGTWSNVNSAGVDNSGPPTAADDVVLELGSGNLTINSTPVCRSLDTTSGTGSYGGTTTHNSGVTLTIGDATAGAGNVALKFNSGMTYNAADDTAQISFISTSTTKQTIDSGGKSLGHVTFNPASNGNFALTTGLTLRSATAILTVSKGTFQSDGTSDNSGLTHTWGKISSVGSATIKLGNSSITLTGASSPVVDVSGITLTAGTSTITLSGTDATFQGGSGLTYYNVVFTGAGTATINNGIPTFTNLTRTGTAAKTDYLKLNASITVTGTFTCNGNSATNRVLVYSNTTGTARTITAATVTVTNSDFQDITGAGAGSWNLSAITGNSGDCGGNTNITFTTPASQTWSGTSGGNWSANAWTSRVPLPQDDVTINAAFSASQTVTADMPRLGKSINWTGATGSPTFAINSTSNTIYGSLTLISGLTLTSNQTFTFAGRSSFTITSAGKVFGGVINITAPSGTYMLSDAFSNGTGNNITLNNGGFNDGGFNVTGLAFNCNNTNVRSLTMSGTWTLSTSGAATFWNLGQTGNLTFSGATSTIVLGSISSNTRTFSGAGLTYGTLTYTVAGSTGELDITGSNSFAQINFSDVTNARNLKFTAATTTTIRNRNGFNVQGTSGKLMTVASITAATHTLSGASTQSCNYLSLTNSIATGGANWYAGANSTNVSGNTGWIFTAAPAGDGRMNRTQNMVNFQNMRSF